VSESERKIKERFYKKEGELKMGKSISQKQIILEKNMVWKKEKYIG
jgi:hypothetical protein